MPLPSRSQKRRIIELVAYTQVFLDSMQGKDIYYNYAVDNSEGIEQLIADLVSEQNRLLSTETKAKTKEGIENYLNECAMNIQQRMIDILSKEVQLLSGILNELSIKTDMLDENVVDDEDVNNEAIDDFEELRISGLRYHSKKKLEACNNTLE